MPETSDSPPVARVLLICGAVILFIWITCGGVVGYFLWQWHLQTPPHGYPIHTTPGAKAPEAALKPLPDADMLASRMKWDQDVYKKVRDEALAGYLQLHPTPAPYDDEAHAALRILAYLSVWGDFYGEGLWQQYDSHATHLFDEGAKFTVWTRMRDVHGDEQHHSSDEVSAMISTSEAIDFRTTHYPALFKFLIYKSALENLVSAQKARVISPGPGTALEKLPQLVDLATQSYGDLLNEHLPNTLLFREGANLLHAVAEDETTLKAVSTGLDHTFDAVDKGDPLASVLDGVFNVEDAWCARGTGTASTVTDEGWQLFRDRLATASKILTDVYAAHPDQSGTPRVMMTVILGQEQPRDQMELWFQRGLKLNPDTFPLYMAKRWYLLPRWYGSDEDVWNFGLECAQSDDWPLARPAFTPSRTLGVRSRKPTAPTSIIIPMPSPTAAGSSNAPSKVVTGKSPRSSSISSETIGTVPSCPAMNMHK
jgi:hypothetical protein